MKAMFRRFLWHDKPDHHKYHLVDLVMCCKPIINGGLEIMRIHYHNKVLLTKWLWRFGVERNSLWRRVVVARFGEKSV